ncbi:WYL domain-containing protein [Actinopolymorpha pittospori]|uniref:DNA-binding transcriptional regulator YafY n=1 Tax=Actinopolymorpha pittospori TaxID=648752 RepID=A0A927MPR5_9ACTN|nr:putative DNA-binding transcriptional regulator YafY [Actinopolymorpha pittospori]
MLSTSARLLRLLALLQVPGAHTGPDLASRLGISARTLRSDVAALRDLGYSVHAVPGVAGGYRLGSGSRLPPLVLDDDEAVALAMGMSLSASHGVTDIADASARALNKVLTLLPARLRPRLASLARATSSAPYGIAAVDTDTLWSIAAAIHTQERLRFAYKDAAGNESHREVEAYRLVLRAGRWYLLAWDAFRDDWRTFRVDRLRVKTPNGRRFTPRPEPNGGLEDRLVRSLQTAPWQTRYRVRLKAPAADIRARAPLAVDVEPDGDDACIVTVGSETAASVARYLSWWETDFEVLDSPELLAQVRLLAERYRAASENLTGHRSSPW